MNGSNVYLINKKNMLGSNSTIKFIKRRILIYNKKDELKDENVYDRKPTHLQVLGCKNAMDGLLYIAHVCIYIAHVIKAEVM